MTTANQFKSYLPIIVLGAAVFGWNLLFVWQGLDFTDMGFLLTKYQQFYSMLPDASWLTCFIGHWFGASFGGSVLAYKIAATMVVSLTAMVTYAGLATLFGLTRILAAFVFLACVFISKAYGNWIDYNNLTALFYVVGAVLLFMGLSRQRRYWVLLSGAVLAANLFVRFPNILGLGLVTAVAAHAWLQRWSWRQAIAWSGVFFAGWALGVAAILALILLHGHGVDYVDGLNAILGLATDDSSHHSGSLLLKLFIRDHLRAFVLALLVVVAGVIVIRYTIHQGRWVRVIVVAVCAIGLAVAFAYSESWQWALPGLLYLGLAWIAWQEKERNSPLTLMALIALAVLVIAPLGSGNGIRNAVYGSWIALPLVLTWLWRTTSGKLLPFVDASEAGRLAALTLALSIAVNALWTAWHYTYRDSPDRWSMTYTISHPLLRGVYTTEARAKVVGELLTVLPTWVKPGDDLLAYPDLPTIHFLTQSRPWLGNPWPMLDRKNKTEKHLEQKRQAHSALPVIVRSIGITHNRTWPLDAQRNESPEREETWQVFDRFVEQNSYQPVWRNAFFEILVSHTGEPASVTSTHKAASWLCLR